MPRSRAWRHAAVTVALAATVSGFVTSCGKSGGTGSSSGSTKASAADIKKCMTTAKTLIDQNSNVTTLGKLPTSPVKASGLAGKRVAIIGGGLSVPEIVHNINYAKQGLALAGIKSTIFDGKFSVPTQLQEITQAINQHYNAIFTMGVSATDITAGVAKAKAAHIPVILQNGYANDPKSYPPLPNFYAIIQTDDQLTGRLEAAKALYDNGCTGQYAVMTVDYSLYVVRAAASMQELQTLCSWCGAKKYTIDYVTDIVGSSRSNALGALTSQPGLKAIITADVWAPYQVDPVHLAANGKNVKFYSEGADSAVVPLVKQGKMASDMQINESSLPAGFVAADDIIRALAGAPASTGVVHLGVSLITPQNYSQLPNQAAELSRLKAYYTKLWGLS